MDHAEFVKALHAVNGGRVDLSMLEALVSEAEALVHTVVEAVEGPADTPAEEASEAPADAAA